MLYLNLPMKRMIINFFLIVFILGLIFSNPDRSGIVFASTGTTSTPMLSSPTPMLPSSTPQLIEPTATVDPESIGDTSGVIAIGTIVVFIILAGVIWGTLELRQDSIKNKPPKE